MRTVEVQLVYPSPFKRTEILSIDEMNAQLDVDMNALWHTNKIPIVSTDQGRCFRDESLLPTSSHNGDPRLSIAIGRCSVDPLLSGTQAPCSLMNDIKSLG
jgi:hypothetical protein